MKFLLLEDMPDRILWFANWSMTNQFQMVAVNHVADARMALAHIKFDVIFLDHDLGGRVFVDRHEANTGYMLCADGWVGQNEQVPVVIHSWNYDGSNSMAHRLQQNGYRGVVTIAPFNEDKFQTIVAGLEELANMAQQEGHGQ